MCGFVGAYSRDGRAVEASALRSGMDLIRHRGPDDDGVLLLDTHSGQTRDAGQGADLGLGFRRLAIIDLTANAAQPMSSADGALHMVYNGEVYNFVELRAELEAKGHTFTSRSDTEVILALYQAEGERAFARLNGMFAIAIWDQRAGRLVLARDRLGIKPLYYAFAGDTLVFGSEIKALMAYPGVKRAIDPSALIQHFTFHFQMGARTLFAGIQLLESGTYAVLEAGARDVAVTRYWDLNFEVRERSLDDAAHELRETIEAAVVRQIRSDVPVGSFLSGGMDTGAITALAHRNIEELHTFTCGFNTEGMDGDERFFDERPESRALAQRLDTIHHEREVVPGDLQTLLPQVAWHLEDPRVGISYQILAMAETVRETLPVVLSGTGGDELFGGYPWRYDQIADLDDAARFDDAYYGIWNRILPESRHADVFADAVRAGAEEPSPRTAFDRLMARCTTADPMNRALFFDTHTFLHGVLSVDDKLNMAHSVESRVPLLDNAVVDLMATIPARYKYAGGQTKIVLKKALEGILPDEVINRRKQGFTPPDRTWYRGPSLEFIKSLILSERFQERGWFKPGAVAALLDEHLSGQHNHRFLIWSLMMFETVNRQFIDRDGCA